MLKQLAKFVFDYDKKTVRGAFLQSLFSIAMLAAYIVVIYLMYVSVRINKEPLSSLWQVIGLMFTHQGAIFINWHNNKTKKNLQDSEQQK